MRSNQTAKYAIDFYDEPMNMRLEVDSKIPTLPSKPFKPLEDIKKLISIRICVYPSSKDEIRILLLDSEQ